MAKTLRVAAAGDIHAGSAERDRVREAFERVEEQADLILLAGDLTQHGQVDEVCVVADAIRELEIPVVAVLGNHDWQSDRPGDLTRALAEAGAVVLERTHTILPVQGVSVGIAGVKGFVGGFGQQWANFGEPIFREERPPEGWLYKVYDEDDSMIDLIFAPNSKPERVQAFLDHSDDIEVFAITLPVMSVTDVLATKLLTLKEHELDYDSVVEIARTCREQIDWDALRDQTAESAYARAFFTLVEELGLAA